MGIFIDTGIFVAARNRRDRLHAPTLGIMKDIYAGVFGDAYTSDYVFSEAIIVTGVRTRSHEAMRDIGKFILTMPRLKFFYTDETIFNRAWNVHGKYQDRMLSFTDATILAWCGQLEIGVVATIDGHFSGILKAVMP